MWLTIPVEKGRPINETRIIGGQRWQRKHREALRQAYGDRTWVPSGNYELLWHALARATHMLITFGLKEMAPTDIERADISNSMIRSSTLGGNKLGRKSDLVLNLCKEVGATQYLSGPHGRDYLDIPSFIRAGIEVVYHDFPAEQPVLSAVDHLFRSKEWPQAHLTSAHYSQNSEAEEEAPLPAQALLAPAHRTVGVAGSSRSPNSKTPSRSSKTSSRPSLTR